MHITPASLHICAQDREFARRAARLKEEQIDIPSRPLDFAEVMGRHRRDALRRESLLDDAVGVSMGVLKPVAEEAVDSWLRAAELSPQNDLLDIRAALKLVEKYLLGSETMERVGSACERLKEVPLSDVPARIDLQNAMRDRKAKEHLRKQQNRVRKLEELDSAFRLLEPEDRERLIAALRHPFYRYRLRRHLGDYSPTGAVQTHQ